MNRKWREPSFSKAANKAHWGVSKAQKNVCLVCTAQYGCDLSFDLLKLFAGEKLPAIHCKLKKIKKKFKV